LPYKIYSKYVSLKSLEIMKTLMAIVALLFSTVISVNAQTKTAIKVSDLPKSIAENLSTAKKGWTPTEAFKMDSKGTMSYEVIAKNGKNEEKLYYDKDGKLTKTENMTVQAAPKKSTAPVKQPATSKTTAQKPAPATSSSSSTKKIE
jgi:hypothetical protein